VTDETAGGEEKKTEAGKEAPEEPPPHHEEQLVETHHTATIAGTSFDYTATAGRVLLREEEGKKKVSFFFVAYTRDDVDDPAERPIVFAFNGGPGSSSVWLHLGLLGPKRVEVDDEGNPGRVPGRLVPNEASILDVADLVFIDPVSTGYTRAIPGEEAKTYHHFTRDIETVGEFIRLYLTRFARWASPRFLIGESYGTTRSAGLAGHLFDRYGMAFNGVMLISSVLNFQTIAVDPKSGSFHRGNDLPYLLYLPVYAATAWYHRRLPDDLQSLELPEVLRKAERFAAGPYLRALWQGSRLDDEERSEVVAELARLTGLSERFVELSDLRVELFHFVKELLRDEGKTVGRLDSRYRGIDRFRVGSTLEHDPSLDAILPAYASTLNDYMRRELAYESDLPYEILNPKVWPWNYEDFQNAFVDVSEPLRSVMTRNPQMRVYVASGYFDLATPYFATEYTLDHLGLEDELRDNVTVSYFEAGHMMYVHRPSREKLREELAAFVRDATA